MIMQKQINALVILIDSVICNFENLKAGENE